mmetsp:Transcript_18716/g.36735  ORF Transcript_18716/g.36735 Transcript_18716/m.36735 type:complete len:104 (-) Transcript_18716:519-830(-)
MLVMFPNSNGIPVSNGGGAAKYVEKKADSTGKSGVPVHLSTNWGILRLWKIAENETPSCQTWTGHAPHQRAIIGSTQTSGVGAPKPVVEACRPKKPYGQVLKT